MIDGMSSAKYMDKQTEISERLRLNLLGGLHLGLLKPGSKLPSIREVAEQHCVDHRAVARAYAELEADKLVEIRGRSGVYVAGSNATPAVVNDDRRTWLATLLVQAWMTQTSFPELNSLVRRVTLHQLRCVCVESTTDHLVALSSELAADFGFTVVPIRFVPQRDGTPEFIDRVRIETELRAADVIATTAFHAPALRDLCEQIGKPLITISIHPGIRDEIGKLIREGPVRVVLADPAFEARAQAFLGSITGGRNVQMVRATAYRRLQADGTRTLFTKAARRELGLPEFHLLAAGVPFISEDSAREICSVITKLVIGPTSRESRETKDKGRESASPPAPQHQI